MAGMDAEAAIRLVVFGQLTIDEHDRPGDDPPTVEYAGDAPYTAVGAAIWTTGVAMVAPAGRDYDLARMGYLHGFGVDRTGVTRREAQALRYRVVYEEDGERRFVLRSSASAFFDTAPALADMPQRYAAATAFHVAAMPLEAAAAIVGGIRAVRPGALLTLDTHEDEISGRQETLKGLLPLLTAFLPSRDEVRLWFGYDDPERALATLSRFGQRLTVIKMGPDGVLMHDADAHQTWHVPPCSGDVIDPTGAGDAFCGGFLAGLTGGDEPTLAARRGAVSASYAIASLGVPKESPSPVEMIDRLRGLLPKHLSGVTP